MGGASAGAALRHVPALDGLRALAVMLVLADHFGFGSVGWIGVQLFFVLSGFLITQILLAERDRPRRSYLVRFYGRRTLRIFPLYFAYLIGVAIVFAATGEPSAFAVQWPYLFTYTFNFHRLSSGYVLSPAVAHFWTLAVEEQFYLVWPLVVFHVRGRALAALSVGLVLLAPLVRFGLLAFFVHIGHVPPFGIKSFTLGQADAFGLGALVAVLRLYGDGLPARGAWLALPALLSVVTFICRPETSAVLWEYTALDLCAAGLVAGLSRPGVLTRFFAWAPWTMIGRVSYGMYVLHVVVREGFTRAVVWLGTRPGVQEIELGALGQAGLFILYSLLVFGAAAASYALMEKRLLALKGRLFA